MVTDDLWWVLSYSVVTNIGLTWYYYSETYLSDATYAIADQYPERLHDLHDTPVTVTKPHVLYVWPIVYDSSCSSGL